MENTARRGLTRRIAYAISVVLTVVAYLFYFAIGVGLDHFMTVIFVAVAWIGAHRRSSRDEAGGQRQRNDQQRVSNALPSCLVPLALRRAVGSVGSLPCGKQPTPPQEARKTSTVVFCDLVGSTAAG